MRNLPCHCGSGKKYKKCCGDPRLSSQSAAVAPESPRLSRGRGRPSSHDLLSLEGLCSLTQDQVAVMVDRENYDNFKSYLDDEVSVELFLIEDQSVLVSIETYDFEMGYEDLFELLITKDGEIRFSGSDPASDQLALCILHHLLLDCLQSADIEQADLSMYTLVSRFAPMRLKKPIQFQGLALVNNEKTFETCLSRGVSFQRDKSSRYFDDYQTTRSLAYYYRGEFANQSLASRLADLENVVALFSNQLTVSVSHLLAHPFAILAPNLLSKAVDYCEGPSRSSGQEHWNKAGWHGPMSFFHKQDSSVELGFIDQIADRFEVFLAHGFQSQSVRVERSFRIRKLSFQDSGTNTAQLQFGAVDGELTLSLLNTQAPPPGDYFNSFYWEASSGTLTVLPQEQILDRLNRAFLFGGIQTSLNTGKAKQKSPFQLTLKSHPDLEKIKKVLEEYGISLQSTLPAPVVIPTELLFEFDSAERKNLCIDIQAVTPEVVKLSAQSSPTFELIVRAMQIGLCGIFSKQAIEISARSKNYRSHELKLYKHTGLIRLLLAEIVQAWSRSMSSDDTMKSQKILANDLKAKAASFIYHIILKNPPQSSAIGLPDLKGKWLSATCIKNIASFISILVSVPEWRKDLFVSHNHFKVNLGQGVQQLLSYLVRAYNQQLKQDHFRVGKAPAQMTISTSRQALRDRELSDRSLIVAEIAAESPLLLPSGQPLHSVRVSGQSLNVINDSDFTSQLSVESSGKLDWFELHPKYFFKGQEVDPSWARSACDGELVSYKDRLYVIDENELPSVRSLENFWRRLSEFKASHRKPDFSSLSFKEIKADRSKILELLGLKRRGVDVIGDSKWMEISKFYDQLDQSEETLRQKMELSLKSFKAELKPFQKDGVLRLLTLHKLGLGGLLCDDMGLGKTVQTLAFLHCLKNDHTDTPRLVVVPTSLAHNWIQEIERFCSDQRYWLFEPTAKNKKNRPSPWELAESPIVIVTYGLLVQHEDYFVQRPWYVSVFDEGQNIKNIRTERRRVCKELDCQHKIALTGTPMENHFGEFFSLVDLCVPGALGEYKNFMALFGPNSQSGVLPPNLEDVKLLK
jgi:hypothetical protein